MAINFSFSHPGIMPSEQSLSIHIQTYSIINWQKGKLFVMSHNHSINARVLYVHCITNYLLTRSICIIFVMMGYGRWNFSLSAAVSPRLIRCWLISVTRTSELLGRQASMLSTPFAISGNTFKWTCRRRRPIDCIARPEAGAPFCWSGWASTPATRSISNA